MTKEEIMKAVIITGANSGIGAATAKLFSENNYFVYLIARNQDRLTQLQQQLQHAKSFSCDFLDSESIKKTTTQIIHSITSNNQQLKAIVNNAGIYQLDRHQIDSQKIWHDQFQVNLFSHVQLTNLMIDQLKKSNGAAIINVSSTLGLKPTADTAAYSATKSAMNTWTVSLAQALGQYQIRANAICPGIVDTPIHQFHHLEQASKQNALSSMANLQCLGRIGRPEELAQSIYFLASEKSAWTTGAILSVDGGINIS